jgi:hypothetical protein
MMRVSHHEWRGPALDEAAAKMLAVTTLYASGEPADAELAARMLDEIMATDGGDVDAVAGLVSVCASLLVLLEFEASIPPGDALRRVGALMAYAESHP